jgi:CRISPR-associated protein Cmr2
MSQAFWEEQLLAYMHDPPDKALAIPGHGARARRYASVMLGRPVRLEDWEKHADHVAAAVERLPMPKAGSEAERAVGPLDHRLTVVHPLSGESHTIVVGDVDENAVVAALQDLAGLPEPSERFLALWRLWPKRLAELHPSFARLPADTRTPDHTIWNHLDITAGMQPSLPNNVAFLSFALGPVQSFIAAARTVRDLWSGSMILSYLAFQGMLPVIKKLGPASLVYPSLRGLPLLDLWLRKKTRIGSKVEPPSTDVRKSPCLPNRFVAVVPWGQDGDTAHELARSCQENAIMAWREMGSAVHRELMSRWQGQWPAWDKHWEEQVHDYFEVRTAVLPWNQAGDATLARLLTDASDFCKGFPEAEKVRRLAEAMPEADRPAFAQRSAGQWQHRLELSARLMAAERGVRSVPAPTAGGLVPPKCSLLGSYEQMGPSGLDDSRRFWEQIAKEFQDHRIGGVRLGERERLCAVSLIKRFCGPAFFVEALELDDPRQLRLDDTATIAAARWLKEARDEGFSLLDPNQVRNRRRDGTWSGQWLHWSRENVDPDEEACPGDVFEQILRARASKKPGKVPAYYAVLQMDGDELGEWLSGTKSPSVEKVMHPKLRDEYFRKLPDQVHVTAALGARRPVGPALHAAISEALANFALHVVPAVVRKHHGTLIYAGGDDVLALLPTATALNCARELRHAFSGEPDVNGSADRGYFPADGRDLLMMGPTATVSAGLVVAHYKEDLRFVLNQARRAEKQAKEAGRNALQITVCRRSGEHTSALCPWDYVGRVTGWVKAFLDGASDRWAYHLKGELPTLQGVGEPAMCAEIKRLVGRAEPETLAKLCPEQPKDAGQRLAESFVEYRSAQVNGQPRFATAAEALANFITLCQTASFLARGRDA